MDLGIGSDDDLFLDVKDSKSKSNIPWSANQCEFEWFVHEKPAANPEDATVDRAQILSYRADNFYGRKQYVEALADYRAGLAIVPLRFLMLRRIFIEGAARCHMYLGGHGNAAVMAKTLLKESLTLEHRMTAHILLATVHDAAGNHGDAVASLHICIEWQRSHVRFWLRLARVYGALYDQMKQRALQDREQPLGCAHRNVCSGLARRAPTPPTNGLDAGSADRVAHNRDSDATSRCAVVSGAIVDGELTPCRTAECVSRSGELSAIAPGESRCDDLLERLDALAIDRDAASSRVKRLYDWKRDYLTCSVCQLAFFSASCLLRAGFLLKSVEHSVDSFAKVKNAHLQKEVEHNLRDLNIQPSILEILHYHTKQTLRKGCQRFSEDSSGSSEQRPANDGEETDCITEDGHVSREVFERRWFSWV